MTNVELVRDVLTRWSTPQPEGEWVVVPTSFAYPSNRTVRIYVSGGSNSVRAFDGGGAFDELDGGGEYDFNAFKVLQGFAKKSGVTVDQRGWLVSEAVAYDDLPSLVPYLAAVSVKASVFLCSKRRKKKLVDLREEVNRILVQRFNQGVQRNHHLLGASNKRHRFDFIVEASQALRLAIDAALPDSSSINAIVVRQLDVRAAQPQGVSQLIVYDDRDKWKSEDIALLRTGGRPFAFTHLPSALSRVVAS